MTRLFTPFFMMAGLLLCFSTLSAQEKVNTTKVDVKPGQEYKITLPSVPGEGYAWMVGSPFDTTLVQLKNQTFIPDPDTALHGKVGKDVLTFFAKKKGEVTVRLAYKRSFERKVQRVEDYHFIIAP